MLNNARKCDEFIGSSTDRQQRWLYRFGDPRNRIGNWEDLVQQNVVMICKMSTFDRAFGHVLSVEPNRPALPKSSRFPNFQNTIIMTFRTFRPELYVPITRNFRQNAQKTVTIGPLRSLLTMTRHSCSQSSILMALQIGEVI